MPERFSLTTCRVGGDTKDLAAVRRRDGTFVIPDLLHPYAGLAAALSDWEALEPMLHSLDVDELTPVDGAREVVPIRFPRKLLCVGANYRDHLAEMGLEKVPESTSPYFFSLPPSTSMIGDGDSIMIPADPAARVDWEAELAVVIGVGGRDIGLADAFDHVAGYACFSDITARGLMRRQNPIAEPFTWDWAGSKGLDTFSPMGAMSPAFQVEDPGALTIRCMVNGVVKQDGTTSDFIAGIAEIIRAASSSWTLEPGDVIATGTPAGVGAPRGERLVDGDVVRVEIEGLAPLTNSVRAR